MAAIFVARRKTHFVTYARCSETLLNEVSVVVDSILSVGLQGVHNGLAGAQKAAEDIASATTIDSSELATNENGTDVTADLATAAVELKVSEHQVKASAAVIRTADEMMGTLIDIKT